VTRWATRVALAAAATLAVVGCGTDPNDSSATPPTTTSVQSLDVVADSNAVNGTDVVPASSPATGEDLTLPSNSAFGTGAEGDLSQPAPLPPLRPGERRFQSITAGERVSWVPSDCIVDVDLEPDRIECGWLIVPIDRSVVGGERGELPVMIVKSVDADAEAKPLVYLTGGPGQSAFDEFDDLWFSTGLDVVSRDRDVVVFDQRGVGNAVPAVKCEASTRFLEVGWGAISDDDGLVELFATCRDELSRNGIDPAVFSVADSAADVADLRTALGFDRWSIYGSSYGTRLALSVEHQDPDGVESLILDSVYPAGVSITSSASAGFDRSIALLNQYCERNVACAAEFGNLVELSDQLLASYSDRRAPNFGGPSVLFTDGDVVEEVLFGLLYDETVIGEIPRIMNRLLARSPDALELVSFVSEDEIGDRALFWAVMCSSDVPLAGPDRRFRPATGGGTALLFSTRRHEMCEALGVAGLSPGVETEPLVPKVPTLVFAGEFDPITPPAWGRQLAEEAAQGRYVEIVGGGHAGAGIDFCTTRLISQFLARPSQPLVNECNPIELVFVTSSLAGTELFTTTRFLETMSSAGTESRTVGLTFDLYESWLAEVVLPEDSELFGSDVLLLTPNRVLTEEVIALSLFEGPDAASSAVDEFATIGGAVEAQRVMFGDVSALHFPVQDGGLRIDGYLLEIPDSDYAVMAVRITSLFDDTTSGDETPSPALAALLASLELI